MSDRKQVAKEKFLKGFNCSQAVFVAFAKDVGLKEENILKLSTGLVLGWVGCKTPVVL